MRTIFAIAAAVLALSAPPSAHAANSPSNADWRKIVLQVWNQLDEDCRGGLGRGEETNAACERRNGVDKILEARGCQFRYPDGWPSLGEYWKCPK